MLNSPRVAISSTFSLHDALPILNDEIAEIENCCQRQEGHPVSPRNHKVQKLTILFGAEFGMMSHVMLRVVFRLRARQAAQDRKSTRLNSSHRCISYAVFCLKKKR